MSRMRDRAAVMVGDVAMRRFSPPVYLSQVDVPGRLHRGWSRCGVVHANAPCAM